MLFHAYWQKAANDANFPKKELEDHYLVERLIHRLQGCAVFCDGSPNALYEGNVERLDPQDYRRTAQFSGDQVLIPGSFAAKFFSVSEDALVDIAPLCAAGQVKLQRFFALDRNLAILCPAGRPGFEDADEADGLHTNQEYVQRMAAFFVPGMHIPEGKNNIRSTRRVVASYEYPRDAVDYREQHYLTAYSPAILHATRQGRDVLYLVHECTTVVNWKEPHTITKLHISLDQGETWTLIGEKEHFHWPHPYLVGETLYLHGVNDVTAEIGIVRLEENGLSDFVSLKPAMERKGEVCQDNREKIYMPSDKGSMFWAAIQDDLMQPESWHYTPCTIVDEAWFREQTNSTAPISRYTTMEGNVVKAPDGSLCNIMRVCGYPSSETNGYAALVRYKDDLSGTEFIPGQKSLVDMPTCRSRFILRYDEQSGLYITFTALPVLEESWPFMQRNVIAMTVSENLVDWEIVDLPLSDWAMENPYVSSLRHGFNYVYWTVLGKDMHLVVREATGPHTSDFHDGTYLTTYKITDYVSFIQERRTGEIYRFRKNKGGI